MTRLADLERFYSLTERLSARMGGRTSLSGLDGRDRPARGVYFFFDDTQHRRDSGDGPRIVRVGTHALKAGSRSTLRQRLTQHRGSGSGGGNHRGSIFRLLVGQALLARAETSECPSWGVKGDATKAAVAMAMDRASLVSAERAVEEKVTAYLSRLNLVWLRVEDEPGPESLRGFIERNSIALLSNFRRPAIDAPTGDWLGNASDRAFVKGSGLWNQRHVDEAYDPRFLDVLTTLAAR